MPTVILRLTDRSGLHTEQASKPSPREETAGPTPQFPMQQVGGNQDLCTSSWLPADAAGPGMPLGGPLGVIGCFSKALAKLKAAAPLQSDFREFK